MKNQILSVIILFFCATILDAQDTAPNFIITDTEGQEHNLYEDYLDNGTTVVIKLFFTSCPPCKSIAPHVQQLYEDWGEGNFDVEFFELSTQSFDHDPRINTYKNTYGITFPGAGIDGGGLAALAPYLSGDFGPYFGTPQFAVIAPDGTVTFGVGGSGNTGRINALNDAIEATGAEGGVVVQAPTTVFPSVIDHFDSSVEIENVEWWIASEGGPVVEEIDLSSLNYFTLNNLEESFPNVENPVLRPVKTDEPVKNVTAIDLITIVKHILAIEVFQDENIKLAADVNNDGVISVTDLSYLQKLILNIFDNFPDNTSYKFVPSEIELTELPGESLMLEFQAVKSGDVNGF